MLACRTKGGTIPPGNAAYAPAPPVSRSFEVTAVTGTSSPVSCDLNGDGVVNAQDVQFAINQALGLPAGTAIGNVDLNRDGAIDVVDLQITIDAALGETGFTYWSQNGIAATSVQKLL